MKRRVVTGIVVTLMLLGALGFVGHTLQRDARSALRPDGTGSWWFPRGGPYILGFESPDPATLAIDGEVVVKGKGLVTKRLVYANGVHAVAFTAPPGARLLWHPPGRRGAPEYVLPSSLSPDPPARAEFTAPGTDHATAAVAVAMLLVLLWFLVRSTRPFADGRIYGPGVAVFVVALFARVYGLSAAGQTWDEDEYWSSGLDYVKNAFAGDTRPESWRWNHEHPPVTKYIAGAGALAEDGFGAARLLFALMGAGACVLTFAAGRRLFGGRAGFFAGMTAALLPHLIAHSRVVGHETPSVFFATLSVWLALSASQDDGERPGWQAARFVGVGIALGLAIATRFTNLLIAPVVAAAALLPARRGTLIRTAAVGFVVIGAVALATGIAIWPLMWHQPIAHSRVVGHETPSVFFATLSVWLALSASQDDGERPGWLAARFVGVGIALGLAIATRFTNLLIAPVVAAAALLPTRRGTLLRTAAIGFVVIGVAALATGIAIWPLMWHHPIAQLRSAMSVLGSQHMPEMYLGRRVQLPPWHYFPVYLLATTPLVVLALAVLAGGARAAFRRERAWLLVLVWLIAPFGVAFSPVRQDGVRYILPALVPLALAAGAGLDALLDRLASAAFVLGVLFVSYLAVTDMRIYPYYLDYYAEQVGGPARVAERRWFEIGWWGEGIADAVRYVNRHAAQGAAVARMAQPNHVTWFRGDLWAHLSDRVLPTTEWAVVNEMGAPGFKPPPDLRLVHLVEAGGAPLVRVYHREAP